MLWPWRPGLESQQPQSLYLFFVPLRFIIDFLPLLILWKLINLGFWFGGASQAAPTKLQASQYNYSKLSTQSIKPNQSAIFSFFNYCRNKRIFCSHANQEKKTRSDIFNLNLKFAPTRSRTQDPRSAIGAI